MSEAVRAAVAARRAAAKASPASTAEHPDQFIQPFGTPKKAAQTLSPNQSAVDAPPSHHCDLAISQRSEGELLFKSCWNGRLNLSSRHPPSNSLPSSLFSLLDADAPQWYEDASEKQGDRRAWYERQDLEILIIANGEVEALDDRVAEFATLLRLDLHNNRISSLPSSFLRLTHLTTVNLSYNLLTSVPCCLLSLDSLVELDLSHNRLGSLWTNDLVSSSRAKRNSWDQHNADETHSVGSNALLARSGSADDQQQSAAHIAHDEVVQPMKSLRRLDLAHNRLGNAALGLAVSNKESSAFHRYSWPPCLVELNLSDNFIRGPLPLSFIGQLKDLVKLALGGNALSDELFTPDASMLAGCTTHLFPALQTLDVQRCEIDDLQKIEEIFGSARTIYLDGRSQIAPSPSDITPPSPAAGIQARQLFWCTSSDAEPPVSGSAKYMAIILDGNGLRRESFKRRGVVRSNLSVQPSRTIDAVPGPPVLPSERSTQPSRQVAGEEGWSSHQARGGEKINRTGLSDWDGIAITPARYPGVKSNALGRSNGEQIVSALGVAESAAVSARGPLTAGGGSTLASAKLTKRQSEALGRVPCKFFRSSGGCSAGTSCPFAHVTPDGGPNSHDTAVLTGAEAGVGGKAICEYFRKGNCRYGAKCLLAHIREGEPPSMDRKNKRASQAGPRAGFGSHCDTKQNPYQDRQHATSWGGHHSDPSQPRLDKSGLIQPHALSSVEHFPLMLSPAPPSSSASQWMAHTLSTTTRGDEFAFGIPDDFQHYVRPGPSPKAPKGLSLPAQDLSSYGVRTASAYVGSPPGTGAFGSSPFANAQSVFFSSSQESDTLASRTSARASSYTRDGDSTAGLRPGLYSQSYTSRDTHQGRWCDVSDERNTSVDDGHNGEDFLPSSLSDLLTPAELERRRKNAASGSLVSSAVPSQIPVQAQNGQRRQSSTVSAIPDVKSAFDRRKASFGHIPGQSLPRDLAAGLSRLHLATSPDQWSSAVASDNSHKPIFGAAEGSNHFQAFSGSPRLSRDSIQRAALGPVGSLRESTGLTFFPAGSQVAVDAHGLGPTAPSSLLPHRAPGGFHSMLSSSIDVASPNGARTRTEELWSATAPGGIASGFPSTRLKNSATETPPQLRAPVDAGTSEIASSQRTWSTGTGTGSTNNLHLAFGAAHNIGSLAPESKNDVTREYLNDEVGLFELE